MNLRALPVNAMLVLAVCSGCNTSPEKPHVVQAQTLDYGSPPSFHLSLSVEQAYEAIPHRRTVWQDADSTASAAEKAYLKTIFEVLDEATAARVAGMRDYAAGHFEYSDPDSDYGQ